MKSIIPNELLPTQDPLSFFEDIYRVSQKAIAASVGQINYGHLEKSKDLIKNRVAEDKKALS